MKNITDKAIIYLRKVLLDNIFTGIMDTTTNDIVRNNLVNRIISAITKRYKLVEKDKTKD